MQSAAGKKPVAKRLTIDEARIIARKTNCQGAEFKRGQREELVLETINLAQRGGWRGCL
jgi:hypothetical protein